MTSARATLAWKIGLLSLAGILAILTAYSTLYWGRYYAGHSAGTLGVTQGTQAANYSWPILVLAADSPLRAQGVREGDSFGFARRSDALRPLGTDEVVDLIVYQNDEVRRIAVRPSAVPPSPEATKLWINYLINMIATMIVLPLGVLVCLRGSHDQAMRTLCLLLLLPQVGFLRFYMPGGALQEFLLFAFALATWISYCAFPYFALQFPAQAPLIGRRAVRLAFLAFFWIYGAVVFASILQYYLGNSAIPIDRLTLAGWRRLLIQASVVMALCAVIAAWRRSAGAERQRLGWVGLCMGMIFTTFLIYSVPALAWIYGDSIGRSVLDTAQLVGYGSLAYAMLRYRLFDFGFVINRTLVFSFTSLLLILVFFLFERFAHQLLHFESAEKNALLSGAFAFMLFFVFNRLHHRVDHFLEKLFFRAWHDNAAALKHFVTKAGHFTSSERLLSALGNELQRFTGAQYALYRTGGNAADGHFTCIDGALTDKPAFIDADEDVAVTLRSTRAHTNLHSIAWNTSGELALPMMQGPNLYGFAIIGAKPNGNLYRPDEIDALAFAVNQVGLDLFALRVKELEVELDDMIRSANINEVRLTGALREAELGRMALLQGTGQGSMS